jgi:hypothetical protein
VVFFLQILINETKILLYKFFTLVFFSLWRYSPNFGLGLPPWNSLFHFCFLDLRHSVGLLGWVARPLPVHKHRKTHIHTQKPNIHALSEIWTHDPGFRASEDNACFRPLAYRDRLYIGTEYVNILSIGTSSFCIITGLPKWSNLVKVRCVCLTQQTTAYGCTRELNAWGSSGAVDERCFSMCKHKEK